jgi:hypothetical protein
MFVAGYEHHTWQCSACGQSERRLVFVRAEPAASEPTERDESVPTQPAASDPGEPADAKPTPGSWERAVDKLRDRQRLLADEAAAAHGRGGPDELARPPTRRSPSVAKPARPPPSPSKLKPVTWRQTRTQPDSGPTGILARLAEKLRNRQATAARPLPAAGESAQFDRVWEGPPDAGQQPGPTATSPLPPPLPRSLSLVPIEGTGPATLVARALAMLSGRGPAFRS